MKLEIRNFLVALSPLDGVTDEPFRLTQTQIAKPDLIFTEFVSAEGLAHGAIKLFDHLLYLPVERPIIAQLFGKDPDSFRLAAAILVRLGFDGVDINFGCPAKTVTQHGSGAAIIGNYDLAAKIIAATRQGISDQDIKLKPKTEKIIERNNKYSHNFVETFCKTSLSQEKPTLSIKTRLGISDFNPDWFKFLDEQHLDFISVHGRTLRQGYSGQANWSTIGQIAHSSQTPIFGNGDLTSRQQAVDYCQKYGTKGALIGRAAMGNPWVFANHQATPTEKFQAMLAHARCFLQLFPDRRFDIMRKYFLLYATGLKNAKLLRSRLVAVSSLADLLSLEAEFTSC